MSNKINHSILRFIFDPPLDQEIKVKDLRGALGSLYPNELLLHHHRKDGKLNYAYPLVQYKIINSECLIIGIQQGAELLSNLDLAAKSISLENQRYTILNKVIEFYHVSIKIINLLERYQFITPWLALNEKNYEKYQKLGSLTKKRELLAKILVGNIISMSKSLGYTVPAPIKPNILNIKEFPAKLKGTPMLGFIGTFSVNFEIPDYWGIGKSVSRGFGTVVKCSK